LAYDSGVAGSGDLPELIRKTAFWFQCISSPGVPSLPEVVSPRVSRGIRQFREERLVQFNFTLIYSVSGLRLAAQLTL